MNDTVSASSKKEELISFIEEIFLHINEFSEYDQYIVEPYSTLKRTSETNKDNEPRDHYFVNLTPPYRAIIRLFERMIGLFQAGRAREQLFDTIYAFPEINEEQKWLLEVENILDLDDDFIPVNLTLEYVERWVECLCGTALAIKKSPEPIHAANISRFFLIGDIGTGKTTFLNYAFSKHHEWMRQKGIIWVRVDLTKSRFQDQTLIQSLEDQTAKIFRGFYHDDFWPKYKDEIKQEITKRFRISPPSHNSRMTLQEAINDYCLPYDHNRTLPYHQHVQKGIKAWLENKFSMIYILDGLDKLGSEESFQKNIREIQKSILGTEKTKHLYIIVMRNRSHVDLIKSYVDPHEFAQFSSLRKESKTFVVLAPKLEELMTKRLDFLNGNWKILINEEQDRIIYPKIKDPEEIDDKLSQILEDCAWISKDNLDVYYQTFLLFLYRSLSFKDYEDAIKSWRTKHVYSLLKDLAGTNFRVLLKILGLAHQRFLETLQLLDIAPSDLLEIAIYLDEIVQNTTIREDERHQAKSMLKEILKKHYRVVEILTKHPISGSKRIEYRYRNNKIIPVASPTTGTTTYIPNVFRVANVSKTPEERTLLLSKVRLLQFLEYKAEASKEEILDYLSDRFGYPIDNLSFDLDDLENDSLVAQSAMWPKDESMPIITYHNTRTGTQMIKNLIKDFNYLAMVCNDILVPEAIVNSLSIKDDFSPHDNWAMWNISRIPQVINLVCLIASLEKTERLRVEELMDNYEPFDLASKIIERVKSVVMKISKPAISEEIKATKILEIIKQSDIARNLKV